MSTLKRRKDGPVDGEHRWLLIGPDGAIQFKALEQSGAKMAGLAPSGFVLIDGNSWMGTDVGRHSPRPIYDGEQPMDECDVLTRPCYYDGSGLQARTVLTKWAAANCDDEVIWVELAEYYKAWLVAE